MEERLHVRVVAGPAGAGALPHALRGEERAQRFGEALGAAVAVDDEAFGGLSPTERGREQRAPHRAVAPRLQRPREHALT
jgi:hypothetical protein